MKRLLQAIGVLLGICSEAAAPSDEDRIHSVVNAIWVVEGGSSTRFPYGIKSIRTRDRNHAREICVNTVRRALKEWREHGRKFQPCFIMYLGCRYCPKETDPIGHANWVRNMKTLVPVPF